MEAKETNNSIMSKLMHSFNAVSAIYQEDMDAVMSDVAVDILGMKDTFKGRNLTFFEKGTILLAGSSDILSDDIKACMFWWMFNEEILENEVKYLIEKSRK